MQRKRGAYSIKTLLSALVTQYPKLNTVIFDNQGDISSYIIIYINGEDARYLDHDDELPREASINLITALVGG